MTPSIWHIFDGVLNRLLYLKPPIILQHVLLRAISFAPAEIWHVCAIWYDMAVVHTLPSSFFTLWVISAVVAEIGSGSVAAGVNGPLARLFNVVGGKGGHQLGEPSDDEWADLWKTGAHDGYVHFDDCPHSRGNFVGWIRCCRLKVDGCDS